MMPEPRAERPRKKPPGPRRAPPGKKSPREAPCPLCGPLPHSLEIENAADLGPDEPRSKFPEEVRALKSPDPALEWFFRFNGGGILACPACGGFFQYAQWTPGGSDDVFRTYVHEAVTRIRLLQVHKTLQYVLRSSRARRTSDTDSFRAGYSKSARASAKLLRSLHRRGREVIECAVEELLRKHRYSEELGEMLRRLEFAHEKQGAEARAREEKVAEYHAAVVLHYAKHVRGAREKGALIKAIAGLTDDNPVVRDTLAKALRRMGAAF